MRVLCVQEMESSTSVSKMAAGVAVQMQLLPAEMQQKTLLLLICRHRVSTSQIIGEKIYERKQAQPTSQPASAAGASRLTLLKGFRFTHYCLFCFFFINPVGK